MTRHQLLMLQRHLQKAQKTYERECGYYSLGDPVRYAIVDAYNDCKTLLALINLKLKKESA